MKIKLKILSSLICSFLINGIAYAQKGAIYYQLTVAENGVNTSWTEHHVIYFTSNNSIDLFIPPAQFKESTLQTGENAVIKTVAMGSKSNRTGFILKDFDKKSLVLADNIYFKKYLIEDTLANFKWKISNERQKILKYNCTKATTSFRGRDYIAWFTDDVPIQNGPWKFCGLPGLIVKVNDAENKYVFELEGLDLKTPFDAEIIHVPIAYANDNTLTHSAFMALFNKKVIEIEANNRASIKTYTANNGRGTVKSNDSLSPKMEKF